MALHFLYHLIVLFQMSLGWALAFVFVSFALPFVWFAVDGRPEDGFVVAVLCAVFTFIGLGVMTTHYTYESVDRSKIATQRMTENGTTKLFVHHPTGTFETTDAYIHENFGDTSKVEVVVEIEDNVWASENESLLVRPKQ